MQGDGGRCCMVKGPCSTQNHRCYLQASLYSFIATSHSAAHQRAIPHSPIRCLVGAAPFAVQIVWSGARQIYRGCQNAGEEGHHRHRHRHRRQSPEVTLLIVSDHRQKTWSYIQQRNSTITKRNAALANCGDDSNGRLAFLAARSA
jgi:hypothetical protein